MAYLLLGDAWAKLFGGLQGQGKSYSAVLQMAATLSRGGHVSSNVELIKGGMEALCLKRHGVKIKFDEQVKLLTPEEIPNFQHNTPAGTDDSPNMVVIDEADLYWFKSDAAATKKHCRDLITFLKLCRQENTLVIFMTQDKNLLDKSLRDLCENWDFRDMAKFRLLGWKPLASWLVSIQRSPGSSARLGPAHWAKKDLDVFKAYNSRQFKGQVKRQGEKGKVALESVRNGAGIRNFLKRYWLIIAFVVGVWWFWGVDHKPKPAEVYPEPAPRKLTVYRGEHKSGAAAAPAETEVLKPEKFQGPDGVSYPVPTGDFLVVRHFEFGVTKIRITLASPPYERHEQFYIGDYSSVLGKVVTGTGLDRGERWVKFSDGTRSKVVIGRAHFAAPVGAGAGDGSGGDGAAVSFDKPEP